MSTNWQQIIERASAIATERQAAKQAKQKVTAEQIEGNIMLLAESGYTPDAQTPAIIQAYMQGYSIMLTGGVGAGKTMLASLLFCCPVCHCQRSVADYGLDGLEEFHKWADDREIVLDDLGAERKTVEYGERDEILKIVIERRDAGWQRTHITTNLTGNEISERYGDRIFDRLGGMCKAFKLAGESRRSPKPVVDPGYTVGGITSSLPGYVQISNEEAERRLQQAAQLDKAAEATE